MTTIGRHQAHERAGAVQSATPGAVRCNISNNYAEEWVQWRGDPRYTCKREERGQNRGMTFDKGLETNGILSRSVPNQPH